MENNLEHIALSPVVDTFLMLVVETRKYQNEASVQKVLGEAQQRLVSVRRRLKRALHRYVVATVGLTNVGKSTLLNALLGAELAPRRNGPCTAAPIEFTYGQSLRVSAIFQDSLHRPSWPCADIESVHRRLTELADSGGETGRLAQKVVVELPDPLLQNGLIIADTPGFGAAQLETASGSHEEALKAYLQADVSQVFWVVLAEQGIGKREMSFHDRFFADLCDDVVVTGSEEWSEDDRKRFRRRFAENFGQRLPTVHFVSGKEGFAARHAHDTARLEVAGIPALENRIRELESAAGRLAAAEQSLRQLADELCYWLSELNGRRPGRTRGFWRPDSWYRWLELADANNLAHELTQKLEKS